MNLNSTRGITIINNYLDQLGGAPKKVIAKECRFECGFMSSRDYILKTHESNCEFNPKNVLKNGKEVYVCEYDNFGCVFKSSYDQVSKHETKCRFDFNLNIKKVLESDIKTICPQCNLDQSIIKEALIETKSNVEKTIRLMIENRLNSPEKKETEVESTDFNIDSDLEYDSESDTEKDLGYTSEDSEKKTTLISNKLPKKPNSTNEKKLQQMIEFGFSNEESLSALEQSNYNLHKALDIVMSQQPYIIQDDIDESDDRAFRNNLEKLLELGYSEKNSINSLKKKNNDLNLALEYLISIDSLNPKVDKKTVSSKSFPRPKGRAPKNKKWNYETGKWVDDKIIIIKKRKPRKIIKDFRRDNAILDDIFPPIPENIVLNKKGEIVKIIYEPLDISKFNSIMSSAYQIKHNTKYQEERDKLLDREYDQDIKIWIQNAQYLIMNIEFFIPPKFKGNPGSLINKDLISAFKKIKLNYNKQMMISTKKITENEQTDKIYKEIMKNVNLGLNYMELLDTIFITDIDYSKINDDNHITKDTLRHTIKTIRNKIPTMRGQLIQFLRFLSELYDSWPTHTIKKEYYDKYI